MARIEDFEDHCWKDVMSADDIKLYSPYARETLSALPSRSWPSIFTTKRTKAARAARWT